MEIKNIQKNASFTVCLNITFKIPSLLSSILDRSMASAKPMNINMGVGVTAFPIKCHVKKAVKQMQQYKLSFSKYVFQQNINFPI